MKLVSLYEYLGKAAGPDLGRKVNSAAHQLGVQYDTKNISNPKYKGKVMIYPESFLDEYFGKSAVEDKPVNGWEDIGDNLPF